MTLSCGCTDTTSCQIEENLSREWEKAGIRFERLPTGGNEWALRRAYAALARHRDPKFVLPPLVGKLGGR